MSQEYSIYINFCDELDADVVRLALPKLNRNIALYGMGEHAQVILDTCLSGGQSTHEFWEDELKP